MIDKKKYNNRFTRICIISAIIVIVLDFELAFFFNELLPVDFVERTVKLIAFSVICYCISFALFYGIFWVNDNIHI